MAVAMISGQREKTVIPAHPPRTDWTDPNLDCNLHKSGNVRAPSSSINSATPSTGVPRAPAPRLPSGLREGAGGARIRAAGCSLREGGRGRGRGGEGIAIPAFADPRRGG